MSNNLICCNCYYEKIGNEVRNITDELPFEIPETWCWCRLKNISVSISAGGDKPNIFSKQPTNECNIPIYSNGIENNGLFGFTNTAKIFNECITISARGTIGFTCVRKKPFVPIVRLITVIPENIIMTEYLKIVCDALLEKGEGTSTPQLTVPFIKEKLIPLPPVNEQNKIINNISIILIKLNSIFDEVNDLNVLIDKTKNKILDYYFGEDSCYKSYFMNKNKEHLKNFIPSKYIGDGDWVLSENMDPNGDYKLIQLKHIGNNQYLNKPYNTVSKEFVNQNNCSIITSGTLLINRLVADRMNCCILPETICNHITSVDVCWIAKNDSIDNEYLMYLLSSPSFQTEVMNKCSGSTRKRISKKNLLDIKVFIHNYEYQLIIKTKIQEIFCLLNSINI